MTPRLTRPLALELDRALGHVAALGPQQVGDGLEGGRLAGPVGAEQADDAALGHLQGDALQDQDDVVVDDLDVVDGEKERAVFGLSTRFRLHVAVLPL